MNRAAYVLGLTLASVALLAEARTYYEMTAEPENNALIESPSLCSLGIGDGGNLIENGQRYSGKCEGGGMSPTIVGTQRFLMHLRFKTDPGYSGDDNRTRTELAVTQKFFPFGERVYIGFRMMIPRGTDISSGTGYYLLQLWQCSPASPIAGIRLTSGTTHTVNFMTNSDSHRAASFHSHEMLPGVWHRFIISVTAGLQEDSGMAVWVDKDPEPKYVTRPIGFDDVICSDRSQSQQGFRVKFGIYKDVEPGKSFEVRYDDFRIGNSYASVKPW